MSLWDIVTSFVSSNTDVLSSAVQGVAAVAGSAIAANANAEAAEIAAQAAQRQTDAINAANAQAQQRFDTIQSQTAPGVSHLRTTALTAPEQLTPEQRFQLDQTRQEALNSLNASGLRGSGRATTAVLRNVESGFRNTAIGQNRNRQDTAANVLAGQNFNAATAGANAVIGQGRDVAAIEGDIGQTRANLETANARLTGQALADVGSIIADANKRRESRFAESSDERERETL